MCLDIIKIPTGQKSLFQSVKKLVCANGRTPFTDTLVPSDGWMILYNQKIDSKRYFVGQIITNNHIHSYNTKQTKSSIAAYHNEILHKAYAFSIRATGADGDLVSKAIYIPSLDYSKNKKSTLNKINKIKKLKKNNKLTKNHIIKLFPELSRSFK